MKLPFENISREILVRKKAETDHNLGIKPEKRTVDIKIGLSSF